MNNYLFAFFLILLFTNCHKDQPGTTACNMEKVYGENAVKVTISNGIWGTVASMEGDFMPMVPPAPARGKTCPVKRTVRIYEYTTLANATRSANSVVFFDSFNTMLIKETTTDENGFFQTEIPAGNYTIVTIEDGKLYAGGLDGNGGLNPFTHSGIGLVKLNILLTYKATF